jgi:hypothetical protein
MKIDAFTKFVLGVIALALSAIAFRPWFQTEVASAQIAPAHAQPAAKKAAASQQWEYKYIYRERGFSKIKDNQWITGDWGFWQEDEDKLLPMPVEMGKKLTQLGQDGWELVTVEPISTMATSYLFGTTSICQQGAFATCPTAAKLDGNSTNGVTTAEKWLFKRPKP